MCIDPGGYATDVIAAAKRLGLHVETLALTHGHGDHLGAVSAVRKEWLAPVWIHELDAPMMTSAERNLSCMIGMPVATDDAEHRVADNGTIRFGTTNVTVIHTPGHTKGSTCFLLRDATPLWLFSGDTLFEDDVGRCDLPGGSFTAIQHSIRTQLYVLPEETVVYPGHGPSTTIGREKRVNKDVRP
jgi:hydroxyacylglutathione hydrolase